MTGLRPALGLVAVMTIVCVLFAAPPAPAAEPQQPRLTPEMLRQREALKEEWARLAAIPAAKDATALCTLPPGAIGSKRAAGDPEAEFWPTRTVAYKFDSSTDADMRNRTQAAMSELEIFTGLDFVHDEAAELPYLKFHDSDGNNSPVGPVTAADGTFPYNLINIVSWDERAVIQHEIMHSLGFLHEHTRPDRDNHVRINQENIDPDVYDNNFPEELSAMTLVDYDYESIMHYGECDGTTCILLCGDCLAMPDGGRTIVTLDEDRQDEIGNRAGLSDLDIFSLQAAYGLPDGPAHQDTAQALPLVCGDPAQGSLAGAGFHISYEALDIGLPGWGDCLSTDSDGVCLDPASLTFFPTAVWYDLGVLPAGNYRLDLSSADEVVAMVMRRDGAGWEQVGVAAASDAASWTASLNRQYRVAVIGRELLSDADFWLALNCGGPNDDSSAPVELAVTGPDVPVNLTAATNDGSTWCGNAATSADVWYAFSAPEGGTLSLATIGEIDDQNDPISPDAVLSVHDYSPYAPGTSANTLACSDTQGNIGGEQHDAGLSYTMAAGERVLIRVSHSAGLLRNGLMMLRHRFASANDRCANAPFVVAGESVFANFDVARIDESFAYQCGGGGKDLYYRFVAPAAGQLRLDTFGSAAINPNGPTALALYADCNSAGQLACATPAPDEAELIYQLAAGEEVLIQLTIATGLPVGQGGSARMHVAFEPVPKYGREPGLPNVPLLDPAAAFGDFDADDDLDLVICGQLTGSATPVTYLMENQGGGNFQPIGTSLPGLTGGAFAWGDYDRDGDLDLLLAGNNGAGNISRVHRNDNGNLDTVAASFDGVSGDVAWADLDNDGDLDAILTGTGSGRHTQIQRNNGDGTFTEVASAGGVPDLRGCAVAVGDLEPDGDLDFVIAGRDAAGLPATTIFVNNGGLSFGMVVLADRLADGDVALGDAAGTPGLDLAVCGLDANGVPRCDVYIQYGSPSAWITRELTGLGEGSLQWIDYNLDGELDLAATGLRGSPVDAHQTWLYQFPGRGTDIVPDDVAGYLPAGTLMVWADVDIPLGTGETPELNGDFYPDVLVAGAPWSIAGEPVTNPATLLYRCESAAFPNLLPPAPTNNSALPGPGYVDLLWNPHSRMTYNLRVGTTPGGSDIVSPGTGSDPYDGFRRLAAPGNIGGGLPHRLYLPNGTYYWSVQYIDSSLTGGRFSTERSFTLEIPVTAYATGTNLPTGDLTSVRAAWGDYDNDDDLDLVVNSAQGARLFRNETGGAFSLVPTTIAAATDGNLRWGDYDNDGDLDLLSVGRLGAQGRSAVYRNDGAGSFVDIGVPIPYLDLSLAEWADFDNDGDLDFIVAGVNDTPGAPRLAVYRNDGGDAFSDVTGSTGIADGTTHQLDVGDIDGDGDLDVLKAADDPLGAVDHVIILFANQGDFVFTPVATNLPQDVAAVTDLGDYDGDGDLDLAMTWEWGFSQYSGVFRYDGGGIYTLTGGFPGVGTADPAGTLDWADYDNDGDLDLLISGDAHSYEPPSSHECIIYMNAGGAFVPGTLQPLPPGEFAAWGDADDDGDLDLFLAGDNGTGTVTPPQVLLANGPLPNTPPVAPVAEAAVEGPLGMVFSWQDAVDAQSAAGELTYNLRVGTTPGGHEVMSGMAAGGPSGRLRRAEPGNVGAATQWHLDLPDGHYYWSVQAVDGGFAASAPSTEQSFTLVPEFVDATTGPLGDTSSSNGVAWGDFNADGFLDLYVTNRSQANKLLVNNGGADFVLATPPLLANTGDGFATAFADYDNDGDLDLYLGNRVGQNVLFRNDAGVFTDGTNGQPLGDGGATFGTSWGDYDGDGDLDLYLTKAPGTNRLLRNEGGGAFVDVSSAPVNSASSSVAGSWADYDNDGDLDLYVSNTSFAPNLMYRNDGGVFTDATISPLDVVSANGGQAWGDYDNDGDLDLYLAGYINDYLFRNDLGGVFVDVTPANLDDPATTLGACWLDFDNDGDLDLYTCNTNAANRLYRNEGGGTFVDIAEGVLAMTDASRGLAAGDYDNDGDVDLYVANQNTANRLLRNENANGNHWLQLDLRGTATNRSAIGARVRVVAAGQAQIREVSGGNSWLSQDALIVSFGLGAATAIDTVTVRWPGGLTQTVLPVPLVDTRVVVQETAISSVDLPGNLPAGFRLANAVPNPFNPSTLIRFELPRAARVELVVYDVAGRRVRTLVAADLGAGRHEVTWRGLDDRGTPVSSGVYMYRLKADNNTRIRSMTLLK